MADKTGTIGDSLTDRVSYSVDTPQKESQVFIGAPDYRVFVWGIEITDDVYAVQVSQQMNDNVGTAEIHIVNDNLKWIVPTALSLMRYDFIPDELSLGDNDGPLFKKGAIGTSTQTRRKITPVKFAKKKIANFRASLGKNQSLGQAGQAVLNRFKNDRNFPFLPGSPMIQMGDPVRVFFKNPWSIANKSQTAGSQEEWYFAFTGYVSAVTEDFDSETNQSKLHLFCEDIRRLLRYMRTTTSPNVFNINVTNELFVGQDAAAFFKRISGDATLATGNAAIQAGMRLVNTNPDGSGPQGIMDFLLFGDTGHRPSNFLNNQTEPGMQLVTGLLGFNPNNKELVIIDGSAGGGAIERKVSEALDRIYPILTEEQVDRYGADWSLGAEPSIAPEPNTFWVILPAKTAFTSESTDPSASFRWPYDWAMQITYYSDFRSRLDVINEFVTKQDSVWYATPKGDIVLEFPQYDMIPQLHAKPWRNILQIQNEFSKFSMTEDDRNITTLTIIEGSPIADINPEGLPPVAIGVEFNPELAARFGVRQKIERRPFKYSRDYLNSSLKALAAMAQELSNSDAFRLEGLETLPNFRAPIGRPYFFKYRNIIGYCVAIHHQIVWGALAQTVYELRYIRHFDVKNATWTKISGDFGWSWVRNTNTSGDSQFGARPVIHSLGGPAENSVQDPSSNMARDLLSEILREEAATGKEVLSTTDKQQLEKIADQLGQPLTLNETERQKLVEQLNQIISRMKA
jgi:hypothetical protein